MPPTPEQPVVDDPAQMTPVQRVQLARMHHQLAERARTGRVGAEREQDR